MCRKQSLEADEKSHKILITGVKKKYIGLQLKCPVFSPILTKFEFSPQIILKISNVKFHGNPSSGSCKDTCGRTDRHDEANMLILGPMWAHLEILHSAQVEHLRVLCESKKNRDYFPVNN
jgi:hypothetical protein